MSDEASPTSALDTGAIELGQAQSTAAETRVARAATYQLLITRFKEMAARGTPVAVEFPGAKRTDTDIPVPTYVLRAPVTRPIENKPDVSDVKYVVVTGGDDHDVYALEFQPDQHRPSEGHSKDKNHLDRLEYELLEGLKTGGVWQSPDQSAPADSRVLGSGVVRPATADPYFACGPRSFSLYPNPSETLLTEAMTASLNQAREQFNPAAHQAATGRLNTLLSFTGPLPSAPPTSPAPTTG